MPVLLMLRRTVRTRRRASATHRLIENWYANFNTIRDLTGLSDGNLSQHLRLLEDAGIVLIEKGFVRRRPRTTVSLTDEGVAAFEAEIETLRAFIKTIDNASSSKRSSSNVEQTPVPGQEA